MVLSSMHGSGALTRVQIHKYVTRDRILDIGDMLSLEMRRSKISLTLIEFDDNYKATTKVRHYVDTADFKLVCHDILHGTFTEWSDHKGTASDDGVRARSLTMRKDVKYRQPFVIKIDNGDGETMPGGAIKMVRATESLTVLLAEFEARKLAQTVLDYIRDWETVNFRRRQESQTVVLPPPDPAPTLNFESEPTIGDAVEEAAVATTRRRGKASRTAS